MKNIIFILTLLFSLSIYSITPISKYKINKKISIVGDGGWDYLTMDESNGRLFVSHSTIVQVINVQKGTIIATISDLKGVHGIALVPEFNKGFITNGKDSSVTVFDLNTYATTDKIKLTNANPDAILYDPFSKKIFVYNGRSSNANMIDAATNKIIGIIQLDGKPEFSVTDGKGKVYVNIEDKAEICEINSTTGKVEHIWSIKPGEEPSGLAFDQQTHRLFSVTDKLLVVMNSDNGKMLTTLPIGDKVDGVAFDKGLKLIYTSNGDGTMTVIKEVNADSFKVIENVNTQKGARTIAIDNTTHHIYLPTAEFGETPAATKENPRPRPSIKTGTFVLLDIEPIIK